MNKAGEAAARAGGEHQEHAPAAQRRRLFEEGVGVRGAHPLEPRVEPLARAADLARELEEPRRRIVAHLPLAVEHAADLRHQRLRVVDPGDAAGELGDGRIGGADPRHRLARGGEQSGEGEDLEAVERRQVGHEPLDERLELHSQGGNERRLDAEPRRLEVSGSPALELGRVGGRQQGEEPRRAEVGARLGGDERQQRRPLESGERRGGGDGRGGLHPPQTTSGARVDATRGPAGTRRNGQARPSRFSSWTLRAIFFLACMALRLRFTEGFSKCWRFLSSVSTPAFSHLRLKRRSAFSKLSSSRTWTIGTVGITSLRLR